MAELKKTINQMGTKEAQTVLMKEEIILVQAANMREARIFHLEKDRQIRCICTRHAKLKLSLGISNVNESSELSFSICFLIGGTTEALLARPWLAIGCGAPNPAYAACASAKCLVEL